MTTLTTPRTRSGRRPPGSARRRGVPRGAGRWLLSAPLLAFLATFTVFPALLGVWISLTDRSVLSRETRFVGLQNFATALTDTQFWESVWFTGRFTVITTVIVLVTGFALALLVHQAFPGKRALLTLLLLPIMIAPSLMGLMFRMALNNDIGLVPALLDIVGLRVSLFSPDSVVTLLMILEVAQWTPFTFLILYSGLQALPEDLFEAAAVDGASRWQEIRHIVLPLMVPAFFAAGFLRAVDALRTFDVIFVLTGGGPGTITSTVSIHIYRTAFVEGSFGLATATALLVMLLMLPLVPLVIRRVVSQPGEVR